MMLQVYLLAMEEWEVNAEKKELFCTCVAINSDKDPNKGIYLELPVRGFSWMMDKGCRKKTHHPLESKNAPELEDAG